MTLDDLDRRILDRVQIDFPIEPRPFQVLADALGSSEAEVLSKVRRLQAEGVIREAGAVFDLRKLGYTSTLCAASVAPEHIEAVTELINGYAEVTHNYLRDNPFNVWFTVIARTEEHIGKILDRIRAAEGVAQVISLPSRRMFKIKVHFQTGGGET